MPASRHAGLQASSGQQRSTAHESVCSGVPPKLQQSCILSILNLQYIFLSVQPAQPEKCGVMRVATSACVVAAPRGLCRALVLAKVTLGSGNILQNKQKR